MIPARVDQQPGVLLHRHEYGNSSLIYDFLSRDYGRFNLLHKGIRSARNSQPLQAFCPLSVSFSGRSDLKSLRGFEAEPLLLAPSLYATGLYLNELIRRLLAPQDPVSGLYERYLLLLAELNYPPDQALIRYFEKDLLQALGHSPLLDCCADGETRVKAEEIYILSEQQGFIRAKSRIAGSYRGAVLLALHHYCLLSEQLPEAKKLMRELIDAQLPQRRLNTRRIMQQWHQQKISGDFS